MLPWFVCWIVAESPSQAMVLLSLNPWRVLWHVESIVWDFVSFKEPSRNVRVMYV